MWHSFFVLSTVGCLLPFTYLSLFVLPSAVGRRFGGEFLSIFFLIFSSFSRSDLVFLTLPLRLHVLFSVWEGKNEFRSQICLLLAPSSRIRDPTPCHFSLSRLSTSGSVR